MLTFASVLVALNTCRVMIQVDITNSYVVYGRFDNVKIGDTNYRIFYIVKINHKISSFSPRFHFLCATYAILNEQN